MGTRALIERAAEFFVQRAATEIVDGFFVQHTQTSTLILAFLEKTGGALHSIMPSRAGEIGLGTSCLPLCLISDGSV